MRDLLQRSGVLLPDGVSILDMVSHVGQLNGSIQRLMWHKLGLVMAAIDDEIRLERASEHVLPNRWAHVIRGAQVRSVTIAAERYFQRRLRRQSRTTPHLPLHHNIPIFSVSDEDSDTSVEIVSLHLPQNAANTIQLHPTMNAVWFHMPLYQTQVRPAARHLQHVPHNRPYLQLHPFSIPGGQSSH
jgi:hypothetical protein